MAFSSHRDVLLVENTSEMITFRRNVSSSRKRRSYETLCSFSNATHETFLAERDKEPSNDPVLTLMQEIFQSVLLK